jgi:4-amino-4-deoxychorismate lyase
MCQLLETIKIKNNSLCNLPYHNDRVNYSRRKLFDLNDPWLLEDYIHFENIDPNLTYKCRVLYGKKIDSFEAIPYNLPKINTLRLVADNDIEYSFKYCNRENIELVKRKSKGADDVLIVKQGFLTDTSFANIVFFDGERWLTPSTPLLKGTKRQFYIDQQIIFEAEITEKSLCLFKKARIINAMIDVDESPDIEICNIF